MRATRVAAADFSTRTATALRESVGDPAVVVFIHDDVHLLDFYWPGRILED